MGARRRTALTVSLPALWLLLGCPVSVPSVAGLEFSGVADGEWYHDNPPFDDISPSACYTGGDPAWFERSLPAPTSDSVQVRLIANEDTDNEEVGLTRLELYVR